MYMYVFVGDCQCNDGWQGVDCNTAIDAKPSVPAQDSSCNTHKDPCINIVINGQFEEVATIACTVQLLEVHLFIMNCIQ